MKQIGDTTYYTKKEAAEIIGCSVGTINARICKTGISGYYMGHAKHYTAEQVQALAEYRNPQKEDSNQ